jgi:hypothetical protein
MMAAFTCSVSAEALCLFRQEQRVVRILMILLCHHFGQAVEFWVLCWAA